MPSRPCLRQSGTLNAILLALTLSTVGCGQGKELAPVKGEVLQYGIPLADAWVEFHPEFKEETAVFIGRTDEMGKFELTYTASANGATVGTYTVKIGTGGLPDPNGGDSSTPQIQLHEEKGVEVKSGENELLFEIRDESPEAE